LRPIDSEIYIILFSSIGARVTITNVISRVDSAPGCLRSLIE